MKILLVEDDEEKISKLNEFILSQFNDLDIKISKSLNSGLSDIIENEYELILLDMSLPNYDYSPDEPDGGSTEIYAGRDILFQMKLRRISTPVIVVTQFDIFGDDNEKTLKQLKEELKDNFEPFYKSTVFFSITSDSWKNELILLLDKLKL
jgi:CheY-like chemotaxis protein